MNEMDNSDTIITQVYTKGEEILQNYGDADNLQVIINLFVFRPIMGSLYLENLSLFFGAKYLVPKMHGLKFPFSRSKSLVPYELEFESKRVN